MFDIYFDPDSGMWRVRVVTRRLLLWVRYSVVCRTKVVAVSGEGATVRSVPVEFSDYGAALNYAKEKGLTEAYTQRKPAVATDLFVTEGYHVA